jgi:hypothetical protein
MAPRRPRLAGLARDESGATLLTALLGLTVLLGFAGLALDAGLAYTARRAAQNAADSAAYSGAVAVMAGDSDPVGHVLVVAKGYGLVDGVDGVAITVNHPPTSGPTAGDRKAVEVIVSRPAGDILAMFSGSPPLIRARAVGVAGIGACIIALDPAGNPGLSLQGSPSVNLVNCSAYVDSAKPQAVTTGGSGSMQARSVEIVGGYQAGSRITTTEGIHTGVPPIVDPYADVPAPSYSGCTYANESISGGATRNYATGASPTVFCGGLQVNANSTANFAPGVYVIKGKLNFAGGSHIRGSGVTLYLTGGAASVQINGGADVQISAPVSGPTAGLVLFQDRASPSGSVSLNGGATQVYTGALYFPGQTVSFNGGTSVSTGECLQIVAGVIQFSGNSQLSLDGCHGYGVRLGAASRLTE